MIALIAIALALVGGAVAVGIYMLSGQTQETIYEAQATLSCLERGGATSDPTNADAIAMSAEGGYSYVALTSDHRFIISFGEGRAETDEIEASYSALPQGDGMLERHGNVVVAWDDAPEAGDEKAVADCLIKQ
jgi:hypothetical protein